MWEMRNLDLHAEIVEIRMNGIGSIRVDDHT